jgi:acetyl-CoA carboxylase biotin carboxyl carrier protein
MVDVTSEIAAVAWKVLVEVGDVVREGDELAILESMKMEIPVIAPQAGRVTAVHVVEGAAVDEGGTVVSLDPDGGAS